MKRRRQPWRPTKGAENVRVGGGAETVGVCVGVLAKSFYSLPHKYTWPTAAREKGPQRPQPGPRGRDVPDP
jgi:hypothetical protein